jgi:hypothetical protein
MSTRQPNPQTPSINKCSAMASPIRQENCAMSKTVMTRPALRLRRIVNDDRTLDQDRRYHMEAHLAVLKLADLLEDAKWVEAMRPTGHYGSLQVRELRKLLFKAQIAEAEETFWSLCDCDDACLVWSCGYQPRENLANAIADYLDRQLSKSYTIEYLIEDARWWP